MGSATTQGLADTVTEGIGSLDQAIAAHLQCNFYPPLPLCYVDPLIRAIHAAEEGDPYCGIILPNALALPRTAEKDTDGTWWVSAQDLLDTCHAWEFVRYTFGEVDVT